MSAVLWEDPGNLRQQMMPNQLYLQAENSREKGRTGFPCG